MAASPARKEPIQWQGWSDGLFEQARKENKFVILDLEAVWCHWCHVMADTTYRDPDVADLINDKYIPVRVDQDAHPDISLRYEDWGWPASIIFAPDSTEIAKRQGYIPPKAMASLLEAVIRDPTPGPIVDPAARWIIEHRALPDGGFRHDEADRAGPYLGDTLAMGQAFLALYESTGDRGWLEKSKMATSFVQGKFKEQMNGGFVTVVPQVNAAGVFQNIVKQVEENVSMARWMNALHHYSGLAGAKSLAEHAMRYLAAPAIIENRHFLTGILGC